MAGHLSRFPTAPSTPLLRAGRNCESRPRPSANTSTARVRTSAWCLGEPSGLLVDIDLDHPTAVALAHTYLPPTQSVFGRPGKPRSHWLYRITTPAEYDSWDSKRLKELTGVPVNPSSSFVSGRLQTVFPPSIHESGEPITWDTDGEPALIDPDELHECAALLAAAVLRHHGIDPDEKPDCRNCSQSFETPPKASDTVSATDEIKPWDDYNARGDFREVLQSHGWVKVRDATAGDDNERWRRPGKKTDHSATHQRRSCVLLLHQFRIAV